MFLKLQGVHKVTGRFQKRLSHCDFNIKRANILLHIGPTSESAI